MRGLIMEYLSKVPNPPSSSRVMLQLGSSGLAVWTVYTLVYTLPNLDSMVLAPLRAAEMSTVNTAALYFTNMVSRGLMGKGMMMVVASSGSTVLSISQVLRSSLVIVGSSAFFCATDPRQCLNREGALSVALVLTGSAVYALAKNGDARSVKAKKSKSAAADDAAETIASPPPMTRRRASLAAATAEKRSPLTRRKT